MANVPVLSAAGATVYLKATGDGSDGDPFIPDHSVSGTVAAALEAGTNNVGDMDVVSLVGDSVDLDSGAGTDNHAGIAWLLPASGGHVVGGTGANPIRVDPVASTVQPVSVASWYPGAGVVASVIGNPSVLASIPNIPSIKIASWFPGADVVASVAGVAKVEASVIGNPSVLASIPNVTGIKIASWFTGADVVASVIGAPNVLASIPNVPSVKIASWYPGADVVASVIGFPNVIASIPNVPTVKIASWFTGADVVASVIGFPSVLASIPNVPTVGVGSFHVPVMPYTTGSPLVGTARVAASTANALAFPAVASRKNYITQISVINAAASYGGGVYLSDGTSTLFVGYAGPAGGGFAPHFPVGIAPAANATVFLGVPVYSLDLYITVTGYQGV